MGLRRDLLVGIAGIAPNFWSNQLKNPIFILGVARSGTTLLNDILSKHKQIAVLSEANDLWDPTGYPWNASNHETPPVWIDVQTYIARWWRDTHPRQQQIRAVFGAYQRLLNKPWFLNKTPLNTYRVPQLLEIFPDARFIHLVRDGRAVVQSYTRKEYSKFLEMPQAFAPYNVYKSEDISRSLADFWQQSLDIVHADDEKLGLTQEGRMIEIQYEHLCDNMRGTLENICQFIGISGNDFAPTVWQIETKSQNHKWKDSLSAALIADIHQRMDKGLREQGYL
jgi:omega-hydroxy-beta-dihydromenaquinone-9 sulfotransferase